MSSICKTRRHETIPQFIQALELCCIPVKDDGTQNFLPLIMRRIIGDIRSCNQVVDYDIRSKQLWISLALTIIRCFAGKDRIRSFESCHFGSTA